MYLAGMSVRLAEVITEALWGTRVSPSTVSDLNKKIYGTIEAWRNRPIEDEHPYVYLDGIVLKRSWAGEVRNVSLLVAIGVNDRGWRRIRTNNPLERILREIRRRTRVVGAFPDGQSALNLAATRLRHIAGTSWSTKRYLNIELLKDQQMRKAAITA